MKKILLVIIIFISSYATPIKDINYGNAVVEKVTSIYDGDTFRANIKGYPKVVSYRMSIRVNGIDTPEMRAKCQREKDLARSAKKMTVSLLRNAKHIELRNIKRGKYFRLIADVYVDDVSLADELLRAGYAVKYDGGTKTDWCK